MGVWQLGHWAAGVALGFNMASIVNNRPAPGWYRGLKSTRMPGSFPVATGSTMRFYGLLFDDSGVLRMDCPQILDGETQ
jgi:hypothetical protein